MKRWEDIKLPDEAALRERQIRREAIRALLEMLAAGCRTKEQAGARLLCAAMAVYVLPGTQQELAEMLGVSEARVSAAVNSAREKLLCLQGTGKAPC